MGGTAEVAVREGKGFLGASGLSQAPSSGNQVPYSSPLEADAEAPLPSGSTAGKPCSLWVAFGVPLAANALAPIRPSLC